MSSPRRSYRRSYRRTPVRTRRRSRKVQEDSPTKKRRSRYAGFIIDIVQEIANFVLDINEASAGLLFLLIPIIYRFVIKWWKKQSYLDNIRIEIDRLNTHYEADRMKNDMEIDLRPYIVSIMANNLVYRAMTGEFYKKDNPLFIPHPVHMTFNPATAPTPIATTAQLTPPRGGGGIFGPRPIVALPGGVVLILGDENYNSVFKDVKKEARNIYRQYKDDALEKVFSMFELD